MPDTRTILPGEELPVDRLKQYLQEQCLIQDTNSPLEAVQFAGGFSNLTYLLKIEDRELVLRRPPHGAIKRGHDMGREYRVLSHLYPHFPKVPKTYAYTEDPEVLGAPFYLMEKVEGIILTGKEVKKRELSPSDFGVISQSWLDTFIELHQLDYEQAGLGELGRPEGYVERQVRNWSKQYLRAATAEVPSAEKVMAWMEEHQPKTYDFSLIHNDYKYDNVVFADDSWTEIRAILDWEMCTLGDPLMDLGTSLGYWVTGEDPEAMQAVSLSPTTAPGNPSRTEIVEAYARLSGRPVRHLTFYYVYGLFKIAVIVQQIFYRYQKGYTQDPRFAHLDQFAKLLCDTAWQAIQKDRIDDL
ncbi:phosphotransferase family protein [Flavilitoribacter nigricans]|uniref:Phosphotransferase n=1 Tax=Flavilitoribacter nigricans (strain ATCC 23147 / DSM 23189 / NBRC 102662 / NCIMB 1420 / SS-2) TaxID=1122177 RepID=A0A2D0NIB1_FLAN2|nr:phosphotransferase family protein [Flavilitoribacter nigricans]PHN08231.1 phosphotransferase [Flavilitoribacter nigricans DSM 23189 = NBRC 102662]